MNLNKFKAQTKSQDEVTSKPQIIRHPILVVAKKTVKFNVFTPLKLIISIIAMVIVPVIWLIITPTYEFFDIVYEVYPTFEIHIIHKTLTESVGFIVFFYSYGLIFPLLLGIFAAPLISEELKSGTMVILVSKPITRHGIIIGKLIVILLFGILVSAISLLIITIVGMTKYPFSDLFEFFFLHFVYSIIVMICFGGLSLGISCLFKKPRNSILIPVFLVIFFFLIFFILKSMFLIGPGYGTISSYEQLQIYHFDLSYHMANIYKFIIEIFVPEAINNNVWLNFFLMFGIFKNDPTLYCNTYGSCGTILGLKVPTNYYSPIISIIIVILLGLLLLLGGIVFFKKRDIS